MNLRNFLLFVIFRLENSHVGQVAVEVVEVQPVAQHEFVGYDEAGIVRCDIAFSAGRLIQQAAYFKGGGLSCLQYLLISSIMST